MHAAKQLNVYGAVAHWSDHQQQQVTELSAEPHCNLVRCDLISYLTMHETGDTSMRHNPTQDRNFMRTVSKGHNLMTGLELDEFDNASVCRDYTHPRDHPAAYTGGSIGVTPDLAQPWKLLRPKCTACTGSRSTFVPSRLCCGMDCFPVPEVFLRRRQSMETARMLLSTMSPKDPNQKFRHPKPTRRHFDQWHFRS